MRTVNDGTVPVFLGITLQDGSWKREDDTEVSIASSDEDPFTDNWLQWDADQPDGVGHTCVELSAMGRLNDVLCEPDVEMRRRGLCEVEDSFCKGVLNSLL